ncbi:transcription factor Sp4-like protein [Cricetulus griseus]|nr:transcription factor Sp4-like protein [Cricetulus griseus]
MKRVMPWALAEERASFLFWLNKGTDCGNTGRLHTHQRSIKEEPTDMSEVIPTAMSYKEPPRLCSAAVRTPWRMTLRHAASAVVCAGQLQSGNGKKFLTQQLPQLRGLEPVPQWTARGQLYWKKFKHLFPYPNSSILE